MTIIYKTCSYGGIDGREREKRYFASEKAAKAAALQNDWNSGYSLYRVTITEEDKGQVSIGEEFISNLICGRDINCKDMSWMRESKREAIEKFLVSDEYKELVEFNQIED